jgi:anaerobic dimethyl sulfoxide reductase subunit A
MATYGTINTGNSREDLLNSRFIILWGWDPANTIWDPGTSLTLARAREQGIPVVAIDPRFTDTAAILADQWIPIRPGTDTAMLIAMAHVIITEGLQDQAFIDRHTVGFDRYRDYVLGREDGAPKAPQWAEAITGVPAATIADLARQYATSKPAALFAGWGPARSALGEQYSRAANVLTAITGNIGVPGGYAAGFMRAYSSRASHRPRGAPRVENPVEAGAPPRKNSLHKLRGGTNPNSHRIHYNKVYDAILRGRAGGYPADIKLLYVAAGNIINQHANTRRGVEAFKSRSLEFIVVQDQFMTPTARLADVVLPANTFMERSDLAPPWLGSPYYIYLNKAIDSLYETRSDVEICRELSVKLGIPWAFGEANEEDMLRGIAAGRNDIDDFEAMKREGVLKIRGLEPTISFKEQVQDPENHPFPTLSGKIEIYCEHIAEMNDPMIPPIPKYISPPENYDDPLAAKYPLQLITTHPKGRTHSSLSMVPWLKEAEPHAAWINSADAAARGISDGDLVDVFNDRGRIRIPAKVTERIMPGVVNVSEGSWYDPDEDGVDRGGCANVLTDDVVSPGGATVANTVLVQVELSPKKATRSVQ